MPLLGAISRAFGFIFNIISSGLYSFTTFTFTNANITGKTGPSLANCLSAYNTTTYPWLNDTGYFNVSPQGIQIWTVPKSGTYEIEVVGAQGGGSAANDCYGAKCIGRFSLTKSDKLKILVGQKGGDSTTGCFTAVGGGGGGSFVTTSANTPLIIAAGGGGKSNCGVTSRVKANAAVTFIGNETYGNQGQDTGGAGGTGGNGGSYRSGQCVDTAGAGGGLSTDGGGFPGSQEGGKAFINGGNGGTGYLNYGGFGYAPGDGGFGGGGGTNEYMGGGGGGYNGGGCGGAASCACGTGAGDDGGLGGGGGGGCYNSGTNQSNSVNADTAQSHGYVKITFIS